MVRGHACLGTYHLMHIVRHGRYLVRCAPASPLLVLFQRQFHPPSSCLLTTLPTVVPTHKKPPSSPCRSPRNIERALISHHLPATSRDLGILNCQNGASQIPPKTSNSYLGTWARTRDHPATKALASLLHQPHQPHQLRLCLYAMLLHVARFRGHTQ